LVEIGITRYENEGKLETPHRHKQAFEFQYVTAGLTAYLDLGTAEELVFRKGDFYVIEPLLGVAKDTRWLSRGLKIYRRRVPSTGKRIEVRSTCQCAKCVMFGSATGKPNDAGLHITAKLWHDNKEFSPLES
jgi:hypothetical protein